MSDILCMKSFTYKEQGKYVSPSCTESSKEAIITEIEQSAAGTQRKKGRRQIRVR